MPNTGFSGPGFALVDVACLLENVTAYEENFQFDLPAEPSLEPRIP
ncbi:MAG TPA: hypothetical protein VII93_05800 [Anaerolineales bacterium]